MTAIATDPTYAWLVAVAALALLGCAILALTRRDADDRDTRRTIQQLEADNTNLTRNWQHACNDLAAMRRERDDARQAVRELLNANAAGYRYPRPQPVDPIDADACRPVWTYGASYDDFNDEFNEIMERGFAEGGEPR